MRRDILIPWFWMGVVLVSGVLSEPIVVEAQTTPKVSLRDIQGDVQIIEAGGAQGRPAVQEEELKPSDKIQTGKKSSVKIILEGLGEISLSEETTWSYESYVIEEEKHRFSAQLALGRLKAKVKKLPQGSSFEIRTPTSVAAVRGTFFGLFVYLFEQQYFTLLEVFENAVVFSNLAGDQSYAVEEGQQSTANEEGNVTPPEESGESETDQALDGEEPPTGGGGSESSPPSTVGETEPGQSGFEQDTSGSQSSGTGAASEESSASQPSTRQSNPNID